MQSLKIILSLSLLVSWTVRCTSFHEETEKEGFKYSIGGNDCFFKNLINEEEKKSEFFSTLLICVEYYFLDKKEIGDSESKQERIWYKTYMAEFSIKNEEHVKSFDETEYFENFIRFYNYDKKKLYVDKLNLKILEHPSIIEIRDTDYKETTIDKRDYTSKKVELQLIKGLNGLKLIKLKDVEFKNDDPFEQPYISEFPMMAWDNEQIKSINENRNFNHFLFRLFWYKENIGKEDPMFFGHYTKNIEKSQLGQFGFLVENIEIVNEGSSVIDIFSRYFGEEVEGIHSLAKDVSSRNKIEGKEQEEKGN